MRFPFLPWKPALVVLAATLLFAVPAEAAGKIAVVDIVKVMQAHPRTKVVEDKFKAAQENAEKNLDLENEDIQKLKMELERMPAESPERLRKEKVYQQRVGNARFNYEWAMKAAVREYVIGLERIYGAVRGEIGRYAEEKGIELVLQRTPELQPLNSGDPKDFALKTRLRAVLYSAPANDITDAVVAVIAAKK
jgi:Skp family chaperone for outer membrane proteins